MAKRPKASPTPLRTRAESTDYRETSRHADVVAFVRALEPRSKLLRIDSMGESGDGQDMPVLVLSSDGAFTPAVAAQKKKLVVLVIANIHAGEVEGKEACLMLARDFTEGKPPAFLREVTLVVVPNYNPDGNDKIDRKNRALDLKNLEGQIGPDGGVGTRYTGGGINLNRDYMKMEATETRHLSRLAGHWRPHLTIDCHTTDGSIHGYELTFDTSHNPMSGPSEPILYMRDTFLPEISRRLEKRSGYRTFFYGNWRQQDDPERGWETYSPLPRYGSHYRGLTGRCDILLEAYSYVDFRTRTDVMYRILVEIFEHAHRNAKLIREIVERAEKDTIERGANPQPDDRIGINYGVAGRDSNGRLVFRYPPHALGGPVPIWGWDIESQRERRIPGKKRVRWKAVNYGRFVPEVAVRRPFAYVIPSSRPDVAADVRRHNVIVETLKSDTPLKVESYVLLGRESTVSPDVGYEERFETIFWVRPERSDFTARAGDFVVRAAQPLASVAIYLLEPHSDDGLVRWNRFEDVKPGDAYPVRRVLEPAALPTETPGPP